ncbi:unnamed protein product, partial [Rotaria sp. Silwood2]
EIFDDDEKVELMKEDIPYDNNKFNDTVDTSEEAGEYDDDD